MSEKVCVIGRKEEIWIFQGLGMKVSFIRETKEAREKLDEAIRENYRFIFITETYAEDLLPWINDLTADSEISVTIIPGIGKKKNLGFLRLRKFSERGIGVDLISSKV